MSRSILRAALALALGVTSSAQAFTLDPARVFINEVHYDDATASGDVGERIEVVATNGADLSQYQIVLYNGSGGAPYDTDPLPVGSGVTCGASVRIAVVTYATNGLQNGPPDGIALVGPGGQLVQFLSYEGSFVGVTGPANGVGSTDIGVAESNATAAGTSLQLRGNGDSYQAMTWATSAAETFGACNTGQTFSGGVDTPPTVVSTVPANNATGVASGANLGVAFSEPVALGATAFELACTSGPRSVVRTGGPTAWTFDPTLDFAPGDTCTATVRAAQVSDLDGAPDAMAADLVFGFVVAPDLPPSVVSTSPAANATNVGLGADLVVTFSEPVNAGASAFELRCPPAGPLPFTLAASAQTTYTLDPAVNFEPLTACALRVVAANVVDLDANANPLPADVTVAFTTGQGAGSYYASVDASSCQALRTTLHALIDDHVAFPYTATTTDTWDILEAADQDPLNPSRVLEVYENVSHPKAGGGNNDYNREHTWPNAYGFNDLSGTDPMGRPVSAAYTDTHMLMLSDITYNNDRGSKPFADCPQASGCSARATQAYNGAGGGPVVYPGNHNWVVSQPTGERDGSFEVWNARKGDVARAILYMDVRYEGGTHGITGQAEPDLIVTNERNDLRTTPSGSFAATGYMGLRSTLLAWSAADPPTALEVLRNDVVQSYQGNRNPFTDHPEWVAIAFAESCGGGPPDALFGNGFEP
jgi:endonuclease I/methionine-rich copper-binding protein CopC